MFSDYQFRPVFSCNEEICAVCGSVSVSLNSACYQFRPFFSCNKYIFCICRAFRMPRNAPNRLDIVGKCGRLIRRVPCVYIIGIDVVNCVRTLVVRRVFVHCCGIQLILCLCCLIRHDIIVHRRRIKFVGSLTGFIRDFKSLKAFHVGFVVYVNLNLRVYLRGKGCFNLLCNAFCCCRCLSAARPNLLNVCRYSRLCASLRFL